MIHDLLIKGGELIDPAQKIHAKRDVAFAGGLVVAIGDDLPREEARQVLEAGGLIVTPGLIQPV